MMHHRKSYKSGVRDMGKKRKNIKVKKKPVWPILVIVAALVLAIAVAVWLGGNPGDGTQQTPGQTNQETSGTGDKLPTTDQSDPTKIAEGLEIEKISSYAGVYMEDGSNEIVSGVMMLILKNTSQQDLQLARIRVVYDGLTAEFEASNIPAGERVVLLEKNRAAMPEGEPKSVETSHVVFFPEPMSVCSDKFELTGGNGYLDVKNISGEDIDGLVRVFYKNASKDLLYGGITYMATLKEGIGAGETIRIVTGHYSESGSRIIHVVYGE